MEKTVTVTQRNFKHLREQYGVKLKDIADVCNLSQQTVNSFEKCKGEYIQINARSYNGDMMIAALQNLINEKLKKHAERSEDTHVGKGRYNKLTDISRRTFVERLRNYLNTERITLEEFCKMCDLATSQFQDWYIERNPMLSKSALRYITAATGWTYDDIKSGDFVIAKNNAKGEKPMSYVPTSKSITPEKQDIEQETHKKNTRFVCDETGFFIEYDIVQHVKQRISKDAFIKAINGEV
jgi:transcriptional regulator with XRE-family HTH domain